jgi:hypothetical protein
MKFNRTICASLLVVLLNAGMLSRVAAHNAAVGVLLGPCSSAYAEGPTGTNDDFTNRNVGWAVPSSTVTAAPATVVFRNTLENTGSLDDVFNVSVRALPAGFRAEISTDFGAHYVTLEGPSAPVPIAVSYRASVTFFLRMAVPSGLNLLNRFDTIIRAESTLNPKVFNETIDRIYTGFVRIEVAWKTVAATGGSSVSEAAPGSEIECEVRYANISNEAGSGNEQLTASNLVISESGNRPPNNWGTTTDHIVGATDTHGGYIVGDREGSTCLTDTINSLAPGESGIFKFRRRIR